MDNGFIIYSAIRLMLFFSLLQVNSLKKSI